MEKSQYKEKGKLSIISQGGLFLKNVVEVTNFSIEWRNMFPNSEIILSISSSDFIDFSKSTETKLTFFPEFLKNNSVRNCCEQLNNCIDKFSYCNNAISLPPIKKNNPNCNANFQIEAAKLGLEKATCEFVLRIRNDILFSNDSFIDDYEEMRQVKRGDFSYFSERVMISPLFTLNPYALERLPFHYSDWFHFGKREDVKVIWDVPLINFGDMVYYENTPHMPGSNELERHFLARLAVEQYIIYNCFKKKFLNIELKYHNDTSSIRDSISILIDNFSICDPDKGYITFSKYKKDLYFMPNKKICITKDIWYTLCNNREKNPKKILTFSREDIYKNDIEDANFEIKSAYLKSKNGSHIGNEIVLLSEKSDGVLVYGPHWRIKKGKYLADIYFTSLVSELGTITVRVTLDHGQVVLSTRVFNFKGYNNEFIKNSDNLKLTIFFENLIERGDDFEIVVETKGIKDAAIAGIKIDECDIPDKVNSELNSESNFDHSKIIPDLDQFPILFKVNLFLIKVVMRKKMRDKLQKKPFEFFNDSKHFAVKKLRNRYMHEYENINFPSDEE